MNTFLFQHVNICLHDKNGEISVKYLYWIIEDFIFYKLIILIFLNIFCEDFCLALLIFVFSLK
jgi:hypothetical protein